MVYADLEEARQYHGALKSIITRHAGDGADLRAMGRVVELCRSAAEAVEDGYCREKIRLVAEYGSELLAHAEHARWQRPSISGAQFLKQQALNALELFQSRLYSLEATRRAMSRQALAGFQLSPR
jgi:signal transduction protein with GAF and PtsI domain